ncbi:MAG: sulfite reductase (NADPH) alpha-component [Trebouxia sp. A1-2]|nr:MAG: sulfite reductase (NADPH) alpha-component [Trebouxia sp. A1-2]
MPNGPSVYSSLCDGFGLEKQHRSKLFWATVFGTPVLLWALSSRSKAKQKPDTHINAFFKDKSAVRAPLAQQPKRKGTGFHSFLKEIPQAHRDATSFGAFLKDPASVAAAVTNNAPSQQASAGPKASDAVIAVLFGTEYGFSKEVAERVAAAIMACGSYWVKLLDMADHADGLDLSNEQAVIAVCSTQGDGVAPTEAREFCDWLGSDAAPALPSTLFAVCALGDKSYVHFCACGKQLDSRLEFLGAKRFADRIDVHKEDLPAIDRWLSGVTSALQALQLQTFQETGDIVGDAAEPAAAKPKRWGKSRPFYGQVVAVEGLCNLASGDDKDTIRVEVDLGESGLQYTPGDALGVYPLNCNQAVEELLQVLGQEGQQKVPCPSWHYQDHDEQAPSPDIPRQLPLQEALVKCYDLRSPKPDLLQLLFEHMPAPAQAASKHANSNGHSSHDTSALSNRNGHHADGSNTSMNGKSQISNGYSNAANGYNLGAETNGYSSDGNGEDSHSSQNGNSSEEPVIHVDGHADGTIQSETHLQATELQHILQDEVEAYLDKRHIIDVLHDFSGSRPPLAALLSCLRPLQPRLYSISSSQLEHPTRVQITVAVVKYVALGKNRIGVTSTFLKERMQVGDHVPVYVAKNPDFRLPQDLATPIIMVGPGTGLAPFRSFMQERLHSQQSSGLQLGQSVLYFGCRRSDQDYLYGPQLQQWADEGRLTLFTAFSRQQDNGDAQNAEQYLEALRQQKRYQRDVWF